MTASKETRKIFELLCDRILKYSQERRATTQPARLEDVQKIVSDYRFNSHDDAVRESLSEHVGILPVIATTLHPFLKRNDIDLGEALIMLAVHDIGELVTGDTIMYAKDAKDDEEEEREALKILEPIYHELYRRMEHPDPADPTACFAKCVDKLSGDFYDYLAPARVTLQRYKEFIDTDSADEIIQKKLDFKLDLMKWDSRIEELFLHSIDQQRKKLKKGETL